ncbi:5'-nucleotidase [Micromonospora sp. NPDC005367]|uniref:5'-nucleotidase n=1 Tax=Micromonospora sp. NPDC005367 TaxID=3155590 RepID=UPI0033B80306
MSGRTPRRLGAVLALAAAVAFAGAAVGASNGFHLTDYSWGAGANDADYSWGVAPAGANDGDYSWGVAPEGDYSWGVAPEGDYSWGVAPQGDYSWGAPSFEANVLVAR